MSTQSIRVSGRTIFCPTSIVFLLAFAQLSHAQTATITTVAGNGSVIENLSNGQTATAAQIPYPTDVDTDSQNNIYFVYSPNSGVGASTNVYEVTASGIISLAFQIANAFGLSYPEGVTVKGDRSALYVTNFNAGSSYVIAATATGNNRIGTNYAFSLPLSPPAGLRYRNGLLYVADVLHNRIVRIGSDNTAVVIAGTGSAGYGGDGGAATQAALHFPAAVTADTAGNVFLTDTANNCIRKISTSGTITTIAGICTKQGFSGDSGAAISALLSGPAGIAVSSTGIVYISDSGNNRIRRINVDGTIETVAGGGQCDGGGFNCVLGDGGLATLGTLRNPLGLTMDSLGRLYIADSGNNRIRMLTFGVTPSSSAPKITANGIVNAASYTAPISQGSWAAIFGSNFSSKPARAWTASDFSGNLLPTTLDGVSVTFNGIPAAIYVVSNTQLNVQVPDGLPNGGVTVAVTNAAGTGMATAIYQSTAPALFTTGQVKTVDGTTLYAYVAAVHLDGTLVGRPNIIPGSRPASVGEIIELYGTGYGPANPPRPSGQLFQYSLLDSLISVTLPTGRFLPLASALVSPGLYQFNFTVPTGLESSTDYSIQVGFLGGDQSQTGVYLPVN